jgi:hypothetical protein
LHRCPSNPLLGVIPDVSPALVSPPTVASKEEYCAQLLELCSDLSGEIVRDYDNLI